MSSATPLLQMNAADFSFSCPDLVEYSLRVLSFTGHEALNELFRFQVTLVSDSPEIPLDASIGARATLRLAGMAGVRSIHGILERLELQTVGRRLSHYRATLVPSISVLQQRFDSRIFQGLSTLEIVQTVLLSASVPPDQLELAVLSSYSKRDLCVQYQESDLAFVSRLLEEEGLYYAFRHREGKDILILADGPHALQPLDGTPILPFHDESRAAALEEEVLYRFEGSAQRVPAKATLRDFRFKQPDVLLEAQQSAQGTPLLEQYYFPGDFQEQALGDRLVRTRLEALQATQALAIARGTCRRLQPGYQFTLERHPRSAFNRAWQLLRVEHEGKEPQALLEEAGAGQVEPTRYESRAWCIPASTPFRPSRSTPRPVIAGVQSAFVTGPPGEEIYCDSWGRVRIQFHWDRQGQRDEHSTCWVRVSQPWAGAGFGGLLLPRVGQEVLVQFLEGDPDRPVITGRVYNGASPVPYSLPAHKTRSTFKTRSSPGGGGFNELRFEDMAGQEEVFLHAQKDFNTVVLHDRTQSVGRHESLSVRQNRSRHVGHDESITIQNDQRVHVVGHARLQVDKTRLEEVKLDRILRVLQGNRTTEVCAGSSSLTVQKDITLESKAGAGVFLVDQGSLTLSAKQGVTLESTSDSVDISAEQKLILHGAVKVSVGSDQITIVAKKKISLGVGASSIELTPSGITISAPQLTSTAIGVHQLVGALIKVG